MTNQYYPQQTLQYSTFIKRGLVEALSDAFVGHPAPIVANTVVHIDFTHERWRLPGVLIKFYEQSLKNIGVGHVEWLDSPQDPNPSNPSLFVQYYHHIYHGDVAFEVWAQSAVDRDIIRDGLIEALTMTSATDAVTNAGGAFLNRFYNSLASTPYGQWHFPVLMLDDITGYGERQQVAPWHPEDDLVFSVAYRVPIVGEFYSNTPTLPTSVGLVQEVDVYPWIDGTDPSPTQNPDNPGAPDWYRFTGWPSNAEYIE